VIDNYECLARFIPTEAWINQNVVKGEAFRPRKDRGIFKTSVTRHDGSNSNEIKNRGTSWTNLPRRNPIKLIGWADVKAGAIRAISIIPSLDTEEDPTNTRDPHHANIIGWDLEMGKQWIQAEEIARQSQFYGILTEPT
jgi:hypothetical protein